MEHLKLDEILEFVSIENYTEENIALATKVNAHIRNCKECFDKVKAFQIIYDEFLDMGHYATFKEHLYNEFFDDKKYEEVDEIEEDFSR